jgi:hypothetical protein
VSGGDEQVAIRGEMPPLPHAGDRFAEMSGGRPNIRNLRAINLL